MQTITLLLLVVDTVILCFALPRILNAASKRDLEKLARAIPAPLSPATLKENAKKIRQGDTRDEVSRLIGPPHDTQGAEWVYFLDGHSGYFVGFDASGRVEKVDLWVS